MKRRWFIYVVVGILFGVFDFYLPSIFPHLSINSYFIGFGFYFGILNGLFLQ